MLTRRLLFAGLLLIGFPLETPAQDKSIVVASTTSTQDSGLFGYLLPRFKEKTGIDVRVVAQGTGQALETASGATPMSSSSMQSRRRRNLSPMASG